MNKTRALCVNRIYVILGEGANLKFQPFYWKDGGHDVRETRDLHILFKFELVPFYISIGKESWVSRCYEWKFPVQQKPLLYLSPF